MTESIFAPFKLTDKESIEKAIQVLESEPEPWPTIDSDTVKTLDSSGLRALGERLKAKCQ